MTPIRESQYTYYAYASASVIWYLNKLFWHLFSIIAFIYIEIDDDKR